MLISRDIPLQIMMILIYSCHLATCHFDVHLRLMQHTQQLYRGISCVLPYPLQKLTLTSSVNIRTKVPPKPGLPFRPSLFEPLDLTMMLKGHTQWVKLTLLYLVTLLRFSLPLFACWLNVSRYRMNIRVLSPMRFHSIYERHLAYLLLYSSFVSIYQACSLTPAKPAKCCSLWQSVFPRRTRFAGACCSRLSSRCWATANHLQCRLWLL